MFDKELFDSAYAALNECLGLKTSEKLLVVCDEPCHEIGDAFRAAGEKLCKESVLVQITPRKNSGNEPPEPVGEWFSQFDVAVMPTSKSLSHTNARRKACEKGTRIATLPGISKDVFKRTMNVDWSRIGTYTRTIAARLSSAKEVYITTEAGTDLRFQTGGRKVKIDDGHIKEKGAFGNLPGGEAFLAPLEGTAEGKIVFDGSFPFVGKLKEPFTLYVKNGQVTRILEHDAKIHLRRVFNMYGQNARNIAEFGVGTHSSAKISGNILEDEKVKGTIHIALGDNASMGGNVKVPVHLDGIIKNPTIELDGKLWMKEGALV